MASEILTFKTCLILHCFRIIGLLGFPAPLSLIPWLYRSVIITYCKIEFDALCCDLLKAFLNSSVVSRTFYCFYLQTYIHML